MLPAFTITLREGLEAFLIVAISLAYLRKTGRDRLVPAVHWGIGLSILISIGAAVLFSRASNQALWEGILAPDRCRARRHAHRPHVAAWQAPEARYRNAPRVIGAAARHEGLCRRVSVHGPDDHARGNGNGAAHGDA